MRKLFFKRLIVMSMTIGALFFIGNNVFADHYSSGTTNHSDFENRSVSCTVGGCGSSSCTLNGQVNVWIFGVGIKVSITCQPGYHACCNLTGASCLAPTTCSELDDPD